MRFDLTARRRSGPFNGGGIDRPWGMTVDGEDNVWVANFGPLELGRSISQADSPSFGESTLRRVTTWAIQYHRRQATRCLRQAARCYCTTASRCTVTGAPPCFIPMMRQTAVDIDQAGNIWSINNWKPDFDIDTVGRIQAAMAS